MSLQPTFSSQNSCIDLLGSGTHIAINVSFCAKASLAVGLPMTEFFALFKNARSTTGIVMMGVRYTENSNCPLQGRVYTDTVRGLEAGAGTCRGRARMVVALEKARAGLIERGDSSRSQSKLYLTLRLPPARSYAIGPRKAGVCIQVKGSCFPLSLAVYYPADCVTSHGLKYRPLRCGR